MDTEYIHIQGMERICFWSQESMVMETFFGGGRDISSTKIKQVSFCMLLDCYSPPRNLGLFLLELVGFGHNCGGGDSRFHKSAESAPGFSLNFTGAVQGPGLPAVICT